MRDKTGLAAALALSAMVAGCESKTAVPVAVSEVVAVTVAPATAAAGGGDLAVTGTVRLKRETGLAFNTAGRIAAITVREGQTVAAGQMLARLDPTGLDAASAAARADQARARADYARLARLGAQGWVTKSRVESAQAAATAASAKVDQTGFDVRFGRIVAPVAGVVLRRAFEPGQMVAAGTPVITIGETSSGYVLRAPLSDADLVRVRLGEGAAVTLAALSPVPVPATVSEIAGRGDDRTGTFQVELRLADRPGQRSGLIGDAVIHTEGPAGVGAAGSGVTVPASAVFAVRADEGFVYVYDAAHRTVGARLVGIGPLTDRDVTITHGLDTGTQVVISGVDRLHDGARVDIAGAATARR